MAVGRRLPFLCRQKMLGESIGSMVATKWSGAHRAQGLQLPSQMVEAIELGEKTRKRQKIEQRT